MKVVPLGVSASISTLKKLWQIGKYVHLRIKTYFYLLAFLQDHIYDVETKTLLIKIKSSRWKESNFLSMDLYTYYTLCFLKVSEV